MPATTLAERADAAASGSRSARRSGHLFYTGYMAALTALTLVGFAPSFYLRGLVPAALPLGPLAPMAVVHGVIATLFMLAFPLQGVLAARGKIAEHMTVGKIALALAAAMTVLAYFAGAAGYHAPRPMSDAMATAFTALPLFGVVTMAIALVLVWRTRRDAQTHKRLMVCLACMMADPGIARMPLIGLAAGNLIVTQTIMLLTLVPLWIRDLAVDGRAHRGTLIGSALFVGIIVARTLAMPTQLWADVVHMLPLYGMR